MSGFELAKIAKNEISNNKPKNEAKNKYSSSSLNQMSAISSSMASSQSQATKKIIVYKSPFYFANLKLAGLKQERRPKIKIQNVPIAVEEEKKEQF